MEEQIGLFCYLLSYVITIAYSDAKKTRIISYLIKINLISTYVEATLNGAENFPKSRYTCEIKLLAIKIKKILNRYLQTWKYFYPGSTRNRKFQTIKNVILEKNQEWFLLS